MNKFRRTAGGAADQPSILFVGFDPALFWLLFYPFLSLSFPHQKSFKCELRRISAWESISNSQLQNCVVKMVLLLDDIEMHPRVQQPRRRSGSKRKWSDAVLSSGLLPPSVRQLISENSSLLLLPRVEISFCFQHRLVINRELRSNKWHRIAHHHLFPQVFSHEIIFY